MTSITHLSACAAQIHASLAQRIPRTIRIDEHTALNAIAAAQAAHATAEEAQKTADLAREHASELATTATSLCTALLGNPSTNPTSSTSPDDDHSTSPATNTNNPSSIFFCPSPILSRIPICCREDSPSPSPFAPLSSASTPYSPPSPSPFSCSSGTYSPPSRIATPTPTPTPSTLTTHSQHLSANAQSWAAVREIYVQNAHFEIGLLTANGEGEGEGGKGNGEGNKEAIQAVMRRLGWKLECAGAWEREEALGRRRLWR